MLQKGRSRPSNPKPTSVREFDAFPSIRGSLGEVVLMTRKQVCTSSVAFILAVVLTGPTALAREYFVGGPVHENDMEIVANYLVGVEMAPMMPGMVHGVDVIHLEADVHATADNVFGYPDGAWVAYLTISYSLTKEGSDWKASGTLKPMVAKDGPHYADNVKMDGPGNYQVVYAFSSPEANGFYRHIDKETGVPAWWQPFSKTFKFVYPQK
jgi:periplasmic iron binding protein